MLVEDVPYTANRYDLATFASCAGHLRSHRREGEHEMPGGDWQLTVVGAEFTQFQQFGSNFLETFRDVLVLLTVGDPHRF